MREPETTIDLVMLVWNMINQLTNYGAFNIFLAAHSYLGFARWMPVKSSRHIIRFAVF